MDYSTVERVGIDIDIDIDIDKKELLEKWKKVS